MASGCQPGQHLVGHDQPSWARIIHQLGAVPAPVPFPTLTAEGLADYSAEALASAAQDLRDEGYQVITEKIDVSGTSSAGEAMRDDLRIGSGQAGHR